MKLLAGLAFAATLVSSTFAHEAAPVYLLRNQLPGLSDTRPELPREIVREIILHRIGADSGASLVDGLPENYDVETAIDWIRQFGLKAATPVVEAQDGEVERLLNMKQIVIVLEGYKPEHRQKLEEKLPLEPSSKPAFYVADPPSHVAKHHLYKELAPAAVDNVDVKIIFADLRKPYSMLDLYNDRQLHHDMIKNGQMELILVLLPESSRVSELNSWASKKASKALKSGTVNELRRRDADSESIMSDDSSFDAKPIAKENTDAVPSPHEWAALPPSAVPACFQSFNSCTAQTANCTGHGVCVDKYALNSGKPASEQAELRLRADDEPAPSCFVCHCYSTLNRPEDSPGGLSTTHWAGNMCQKKDVSVPFWLITSFTVLLVGAITFSISLLFNVGEEKLPGVIGAGVSRTSK